VIPIDGGVLAGNPMVAQRSEPRASRDGPVPPQRSGAG
jgi:hypothetical protein